MLNIIVSTYQQVRPLYCLIESLFCQRPYDVGVSIYHDGPDDYIIRDNLIYRYVVPGPWLKYQATEKRYNDFGHSLRAIGLEKLESKKDDWVLFTNGDNYYCPAFVQEMLEPIENHPDMNIGVVFCDMVHSHNRTDSSSKSTYGYFETDFKPYKCDIGAFIVRQDIAKAVGFNHRNNEADAEFIKELLEYQKTNRFEIFKVNKVLFVHN